MLKFNSDTRTMLFGCEDAELEDSERFKQYFVANQAYNELNSNQSLWILVGHKGVGKSALLRRAFIDDVESGKLAVWVQPGDLLLSTPTEKNIDFNLLIENWKNGLLNSIAKKVISDLTDRDKDTLGDISISTTPSKFLSSIYDFLTTFADKHVDGVKSSISRSLSRNKSITIYIDDIDRGWSANHTDIRSISALINAMRDITGVNAGVKTHQWPE